MLELRLLSVIHGLNIEGLDHRVGHFRPLKIIRYIIERLVLSIVRFFCIA